MNKWKKIISIVLIIFLPPLLWQDRNTAMIMTTVLLSHLLIILKIEQIYEGE